MFEGELFSISFIFCILQEFLVFFHYLICFCFFLKRPHDACPFMIFQRHLYVNVQILWDRMKILVYGFPMFETLVRPKTWVFAWHVEKSSWSEILPWLKSRILPLLSCMIFKIIKAFISFNSLICKMGICLPWLLRALMETMSVEHFSHSKLFVHARSLDSSPLLPCLLDTGFRWPCFNISAIIKGNI